MQNNKLSIITICYNDKGLEKTAKSIINQTWQNFEWIVIDGGSKDEIQQLWNKYKFRINSFVSEKDNGIYDACNKGIRHASGEYIIFLNAGDSFHDNDVLKDIFESKSYNSDILYGDTKFIKNKLLNFGEIVKPADEINDVFFINENICTPSAFIKRELFNKFGCFNQQYKIAADLEKWIIFQQNGTSFQKIERIVSDFDTTGMSNNKKYHLLHKNERANVINKYFSKEILEKEIALHKRNVTLLQNIFSVINTPDCNGKEIRIFGRRFLYRKRINE